MHKAALMALFQSLSMYTWAGESSSRSCSAFLHETWQLMTAHRSGLVRNWWVGIIIIVSVTFVRHFRTTRCRVCCTRLLTPRTSDFRLHATHFKSGNPRVTPHTTALHHIPFDITLAPLAHHLKPTAWDLESTILASHNGPHPSALTTSETFLESDFKSRISHYTPLIQSSHCIKLT